MPIATQQSEFLRLRSYLNPAIKGATVDAVLNSLATSTSYLVNSVYAVNQNLFITTASAQYLDLLLSQYGITRPASVGISDDSFREIGLQIKNRKQVRDLINNLLDAIFGDSFTKAYSSSSLLEPYDLNDGDTLIVSFDGGPPSTITFNAANFVNIHAALAIEVADAIVASLTSQNLSGLASIANNGLGNYVQLFSSTIGPRSSVTVLGGSAQNVLVFPEPSLGTGGNASTQWTISVQSDGRMRFTWSGGSNPNLGKLLPGYYVNVYGGGFTSSTNVGSFTIIDAVGGTVGNSYFDIYNPTGTTGIVTQGTDTAVLFFVPIRETIQSNGYYAALYQVETNVVQIFLPATTKVVSRSREGSAHLHDPPRGTFAFYAQPNPGDSFSITSAITLIAGADFVIGATIPETMANMATAIDDLNTGLVAFPDVFSNVNTVLIQNDSLANTLTIVYTGSADIVASGPQGFNISLEPNQQGPYTYDLSQPFTVGAVHSVLTEDVNAGTGRVVLVESSVGFPNGNASVIFDYGGPTQEIAQTIAVPSNNSILLSPINALQFDHPAGQQVRLIVSNAPVVLATDGSDYEFFLTDVVGGRVYCQELIQQVIAAGITLNFVILYPNSIGLGKSDTPYDEIAYIYGPNPVDVVYPVNDLGGT
jgi:hypothetical protein